MKWFALFVSILITFSAYAAEYLSIIGVYNREPIYIIDEWVQYHLNEGVDKMYLLDYLNTSISSPYIDSGNLVVIKCSVDGSSPSKSHQLSSLSNLSHWYAVVQPGYFIMRSATNQTIRQRIEQFENTSDMPLFAFDYNSWISQSIYCTAFFKGD